METAPSTPAPDQTESAGDAPGIDVAISPAPADLPGLDSPLSATAGGPGLVYARLLALKAAVAPLDKDRRMEVKGQLRYKFRGIDDLYNHLHSLLGEFGLLLVPGECLSVEQSVYESPARYQDAPPTRSNHVRVLQRYRWMAMDGSTMAVELPGEGMDSGDKATGKALSMAQKYALIQSLGLPTGEPDTDDFATEGTPAVRPDTEPEPAAARRSPPAPEPAGDFDTAAAEKAIEQASDADALALVRRRIVAATGARSIDSETGNRLMRLCRDRADGFGT